MSYKRNGIESVPEIDYIDNGIHYGDPKLIHAALKAWLTKRGRESIDPNTWNRPFDYRKTKKARP
jgi:hypothetical protein